MAHFTFITPIAFTEIAHPRATDKYRYADIYRYALSIHNSITEYLDGIDAYIDERNDNLKIEGSQYTFEERQEAKIIKTMLLGLKAQLDYVDWSAYEKWKLTMETFDVINRLCPSFEHPLTRRKRDDFRPPWPCVCEHQRQPNCEATIHNHSENEMRIASAEYEKYIRSFN